MAEQQPQPLAVEPVRGSKTAWESILPSGGICIMHAHKKLATKLS